VPSAIGTASSLGSITFFYEAEGRGGN
jgi:hypothetical protein